MTINGLTIANRIVMAPMTRAQSPGGIPTPELADYYARRAANEVGLIVTEASYIGHPSAGQHGDVSRLYGNDALDGWRQAVDSVHDAGGRIFAQLQHVGMARKYGDPPFPEAPPMGPSGVPLEANGPPGREMTHSDIDAVVEAFAASASDAERVGFDGIELHGAHGYLIDQFLWEVTNRRTDAYGGDLRARTRFAREVLSAMRSRVSAAFPIVVRLSQWKSNDFSAKVATSPVELGIIAGTLVDAGADGFHASTRRFWEPEFDGSGLNLAGWLKKLTGKPTISVGSVGLNADFTTSIAGGPATKTGIEDLLQRMADDEFDMIAVGRSLLADPSWARKILRGHPEEAMPFTPAALTVLN